MPEVKTSPLQNYLNSELEIYPSEHELQTIMKLALNQDAHESNVGYRFERTKHNPRELAFYEQWKKENQPIAGINSGNGILQDLFIESKVGDPFYKKWVLEINNRDRMIVATVIQWLGSNVGMGFLYSVLERFNARIVEK